MVEQAKDTSRSEVYRTLLESTKAIPWQIDWNTATFSYIGPQIEALLGWPVSSWVTALDWAERIHPDERQQVVEYCMSQSANGIDHEADYRALTADGRHIWIRDVVHVIRDEVGEVTSLVGFMFDISERKENEDRIEELQRSLMALSYQDGLTGVANRRRFDEVLANEWQKSVETGSPLSLILGDIDLFKVYNDLNGHLLGDDCLKAVAQCLKSAATRSQDLVARYGGEEFAILLPGTSPSDALAVAEHCRRSIRQSGIKHCEGRLLSMSFGVGTRSGDDAIDIREFFSEIDRKLYAAKSGGRDAIVA